MEPATNEAAKLAAAARALLRNAKERQPHDAVFDSRLSDISIPQTELAMLQDALTAYDRSVK
jgi:hypothetical protein